MADDVAPQAPEATSTPVTAPDDAKSTITASEAARILAQARKRQPNSQDASAGEATPADESAEQADAAPPQEATGETESSDPAQDAPPLDLPRSWDRDRSRYWNQLDRQTQELLLEDDRKGTEAVRNSQNEAAAERKNFEAERQKMEQARQQYESAIPALLQALQQSINSDFPDIQNEADIDRLAREDWARYLIYQRSREKLATAANEARAAQERQLSELQGKWQAFAAEQDAKFVKSAPEFADKEKSASLQREAVNVLKEIGFTEDELARNWNGQQALSLRDARLQMLIRDSVRYRQAQAAVKKAPVKSVPPVTRPGAAPAPGRALESQIKQLESALDKATGNRSARLAAELHALRRQAAQR